MNISQDMLREILVAPGHISESDFKFAVAEAEKNDATIEDTLIAQDLISDDHLGMAVADHFDLHFISLHETVIEDSFLGLVPEIVARTQHAVVFGATTDTVKVATTDPDNYEFIALLEKKSGKRVDAYFTTEHNLSEAFKYYKGDLREQIENLIAHARETGDEGTTVKLVNLMLEYANDSRASDIHIEPLAHEILVRFRVDGILHEAARYPRELHEKIVFRIKIMSHMQTDEHAAAQDGRFDYEHNDEAFDVRVSVIPITGGENVVMRLLVPDVHQYTLETLGLRDPDYQKLIRASQKPHGMILTVGPTGSGKTTVLYTILEKLNRPEVNIMTIEDPVEYSIEGVQQTQVNAKKNLTFATGLRSIVRQDPDIIMVGEIRDNETADIAINSAMTGHLVLSTLHTNDAATTFPRLIEMNVEPFLIASSVNLIVALRLVRVICTHCKESYLPDEHERELLLANPDIVSYIREQSGTEDLSELRMYRGKGCTACGNTGFGGRTGIYELLEMNEKIRTHIIERASASVINDEAKRGGMTSLFYDGVAKVLNGTTTLEEVLKAARV
jgi:type IV pilus assembly protein PilB